MTTPTVGKSWRAYWLPERSAVNALKEVLADYLDLKGKPARVVLCKAERIVQVAGVTVREPDPTCEPICSDGHIYFVLEEDNQKP